MSRRIVQGVCLAVFGLLASAANAAATVTSTNVTATSPAGRFLIDDANTGGTNMTVTGTSDGNTADTVDLNCYSGSAESPLDSNVPVQSDGSFSDTVALDALDQQTCVLRAVPSGDETDYPPGSNSSFTGPTLAVGQRTETRLTDGVNASKLEDYYLYASQLRGAFDYSSLGDCLVNDSYVYDPVTLATSPALDYCNASFSDANGMSQTKGWAPPTRSELMVDGNQGYLAANIQNLDDFGVDGISLPGFPSLSYSYYINPVSGNLLLTESDQVVQCSPGGATFPPNSTSCTSFTPTGVIVSTRITQTQDGRISTVLQTFSSADGKQHSLNLLEDNEFFHPNQDGELNFPWNGQGMTPYTTAGASISPSGHAGPASFFAKGSASGVNDADQGAVTFASPPSATKIVGTTNNVDLYSRVDLQYLRTVPAHGSVALGFTYSNSLNSSEPLSDAAAAQTTFVPTISVASPANGATVLTGGVNGTAHDATGLTSVTVNGKVGTLTSGGGWNANVPLHGGKNTISAVATNVFGNTAQAKLSVTVPRVTLSNLEQSHPKWREKPVSGKSLPPVGTAFSFKLNEPATLTMAFSHAGAKKGTLSFTGTTGSNRRTFKGRLSNGRRLAPGKYVVTVTASAYGLKTKPQALRFTIVR